MRLPLITSALSLAIAAAAAEKTFPEQATFFGMCDASAATSIDGEHFIVADDEDNILRVYRRDGGKAVSEHDLSEFMGNQGKKKPKEADLEAGAQIGSRTFWITSHGRNSKGKPSPERHRLFATEVQFSEGKVEVRQSGQSYDGLLGDLVAAPQLAKYKLAEAAELAPKSPSAFNIEGLAATPDNQLLIGFRNPIPEGKALIVPLLNPTEVIQGKRPAFGAPVELDLNGLGIRSLGYYDGRYVIIAGSFADGEGSRLYEWNGKDQPKMVKGVTFTGLNPEGMAFHRADGSSEYFVLSDDGSLEIDGVPCKKLKDPAQKRFRGRVVRF